MKQFATALWSRLLARADRTSPVRLVLFGYLSYILIGWGLLCLPWSHGTQPASTLDHLFTAASAVSTTGLTTVSMADAYSGFGEAVVLALIQLGGLGYMTVGSFFVLALSGRLSPLRTRVGSNVISLPAGFDLPAFLRLMVLFTLTFEMLGAVGLYSLVFAPADAPQPVWQSVFHSVSAFCTAGFGLFNDSLESFRGSVTLNLIVIALSYAGATGFIVVSDAWGAVIRQSRPVTLTTKIILLSTFAISLMGTVLLFVDEPALRMLPPPERLMAAWFQAMTASTTVGFDTVPISSLSASSVFLLTVIMLIGASPAGTGGGLKTTTFTALWAVMLSVLRRRPAVLFLGREIPPIRVRTAVASLLFYCITLGAGVYALSLVENGSLADQAFECASALGTVGLSRGITGGLSDWGKAIIIALMFVGRVGPIALGMAFFAPRSESPATTVHMEDVVV